MRSTLETDSWNRYVVFYDGKFRGDFVTFLEAMHYACTNWDRGPYLVRRVGRPPSIQYRRVDDNR